MENSRSPSQQPAKQTLVSITDTIQESGQVLGEIVVICFLHLQVLQPDPAHC